ncbi:uncharacterized protein Dwil_GK17196 [Drosophila willistoni]|uniref:Uncharacterized protein n=1 Tax=Drosophila willistoni TaxID=7260 RepID=B4MKT6_DROWI|nr:circumsporozoite protein [Drosophila willistoni]EDW72792.1 uncharacterized protein Dwil_GK17196 [Drosophila willistoni]
MMRATLKITQRALITNNPVKNWDGPRLVLKEMKSPLYTAGPFGSSPFTLSSARFYSLKGGDAGGGGDGDNAAKASSLSGFAAPNMGGGIIGGNAPSVTDATAKVMSSGGGSNNNKSSSYGQDNEGAAAGAKNMATSEMAADQAIIRPGKLGAAEPMECFNSAEPPTRGKAGSSGSGSSSNDHNQSSKAKSEGLGSGPSSLNEAVNMANKQIQEIIANSPDREQVEKYFFRVVAFIYDLSYLMGTWTVRFIEQKIIQNKMVQHYWKRFHEKMEQAKKD